MTAHFAKRGPVAVITLYNPPMNGLGLATRQAFMQALRQAEQDADVHAIVINGAGKQFCSGADIKEFGTDLTFAEPNLHTMIHAVEHATKPVVVALHGLTMGGGLELALGCHYRVVAAGTQIALPEVKLGLLPGAGGTQRLPRVLGVEPALNMIITGNSVPAEMLAQAPGQKLFDKLVPSAENILEEAVAFAESIADVRPLPQVRQLPCAHPQGEAYFQFARNMARGMARHLPAPVKCVDAVQVATQTRMDEGLLKERDLFLSLMMTPESRSLRHLFFAERATSKIADVPADTPLRPIQKVGIIGAGTMGGGIAMNFANAGIPVVIVEQKQEPLDRGLATIRKNYERTASRGGLTAAQVEERCALITGSLSMEDSFKDVDLVIEAVFERMDIKKDIFTKLDAICKPGAILATNTSGLDIDEIASVTKRPESVIGLHFFSPANVMKLLEIVRADHTSKEVIATSMKRAKQIGKVAVLVGVCPGFVGNRILGARQREAQKLVMEGAMPWDIDRVLYDFGFPMGPFAMSDLAGLDIGWVKEKSKGESIRDVLCEADRRGQKTGAGYYDYDENRVAKPSPFTEKVINDFIVKSGANPRKISDEEILERCIFPMINEGVKILEEGKAQRASDIDVVWIYGYGWPVYRGGPMFWGDLEGPGKIVEALERHGVKVADSLKVKA